MHDCDDVEHDEMVDHFVVAHELPVAFAMALTSYLRGLEQIYPDAGLDGCRLASVVYRALADYNRETDPTEYRRVYNAAAHSLRNEVTLICQRLEEEES
jgi:hypothetical protein